jgi:hypothetical protein
LADLMSFAWPRYSMSLDPHMSSATASRICSDSLSIYFGNALAGFSMLKRLFRIPS